MSYLSVPGLVVLTSESDSPSPRHEPSASWRGKSIAPRSWSRVCRTAPWIRLLSGLTSPPSMVESGAASWIASVRATRASRSVSPGNGGGQKTPDTCGPTSPGSSANASQQQSFWRMSLATSRWGFPKSEEGWKRWGTALARECSARRRLARYTNAGGCSSSPLIPTPTACDHKGSGRPRHERTANNNLRDWFKIRHGMLYPPVAVVEWMMGLPIGYTDFPPLATESTRSLRPTRCESSPPN